MQAVGEVWTAGRFDVFLPTHARITSDLTNRVRPQVAGADRLRQIELAGRDDVTFDLEPDR